MCRDLECPMRQRCYRYTATPNIPYQWYNNFNKKEYDIKCDHFIHNENYDIELDPSEPDREEGEFK